MTAHGGVIAKLEGVEACLELPGVIYAEYLLPLGHNVIENNSMAQSVFRAYINAPDLASLKNTITQMQKLVRVEDENGKDMLFLPFDVERIADTVKK